MNYTILHLHTDFSNGTTNIDSVTKYTEYIEKAKGLGMTSLAFTEHGNVYSWLSKMKACSKAGIKYIHGVEIYITESLEEKTRDNYHTVLLAKNQAGFEEINRLVSISNNREDGHFYYVPRISMDEFEQISCNVIVTSACLGGVLGKGNDTSKSRYLKYFIDHKDTCFLEIQHHNVEKQIRHNKMLIELSEKFGIKLVVGTDTHSLDEVKAKGRSMLQKAKGIHFDDEDGWNLTMMSYDELVKEYEEQSFITDSTLSKAIENTNRIADMIGEYPLDTSHKYPSMSDNPEEAVRKEVIDGIVEKGVNKQADYQKYVDRIVEEMAVYKHNGAFNFMLLMSDVIHFCKRNGIKTGYGRGSVTGSVVAYLMGITEMDSVEHDLNFSRFMNPERVSLSDVDTDIGRSRREEVREYLFNKKDVYCSDIVTFNTIALKGAIKEIGRALNMPIEKVNIISNDVEDKEEKLRAEYPLLFEYVDIVLGTIISVGIHPSGVVTSPFPIEGVVSTYTSKSTQYPITQLQMKEIDSLNFVKLDLLGLDAVDIIQLSCEYADIDFITPKTLDDEDNYVWDDLSEDTRFIFQLESDFARSYFKQLLSKETMDKMRKNNPDFKRIDLLGVGNGAIRPAGSSYRDALARGEVRDNGHEALNKVLAKTNGEAVYQEDIIRFLHELCGFSMGEADSVRRSMSKKGDTEAHVPKIKAGFVKYMSEHYNMPQQESESLIESFLRVVIDASAYLFSLNHAQSYSYMGYAEAWLRHYYPLEFMTAFLEVKQDKEDDTIAMSAYAKEKGVDIKLPKFGYAKGGYMFDKVTNTIYKGTASIKTFNRKTGDELYELAKGKDYNDFVDLLVDITESGITGYSSIKKLGGLGFFSRYGKNKKIQDFIDLFFDGKGIKYDKKHTQKTKLARLEKLREIWTELEDTDLNIITQVRTEMELLGYGDSVYPEMEENIYVVSKAEEKSWCTILNCYNIHRGENMKIYMSHASTAGIKKMEDTGVIEVYNFKTDRQGKKWVDGYTLIQ